MTPVPQVGIVAFALRYEETKECVGLMYRPGLWPNGKSERQRSKAPAGRRRYERQKRNQRQLRRPEASGTKFDVLRELNV